MMRLDAKCRRSTIGRPLSPIEIKVEVSNPGLVFNRTRSKGQFFTRSFTKYNQRHDRLEATVCLCLVTGGTIAHSTKYLSACTSDYTRMVLSIWIPR